MSYQSGPQLGVPPFTKYVKILVIANAVLWLGLVVILQGMILSDNSVFQYLGLVPGRLLHNFFLWQPFTYMFLHSSNVYHILFNMLVVWMFGSELESKWGNKFFITYYMVCGVGAALIYSAIMIIYSLFSGDVLALATPVVGASGAVYGLILAYGIVFSERIIHFMMIFPMKAKYFAMILGGVEFLTMMNSGPESKVANLAHLGGLLSGFIFLNVWVKWRQKQKSNPSSKRTGKLKLVVNNEREAGHDDKKNGPKYWN
jgi:membrane associated rhomboid family serine protease